MRDRRRVRPISMRPPGAAPVASQGGSRQGGGLEFTPQELTAWQTIRKAWHASVPRANDINGLFVATGRREVRFDWRHPLAIPFVLLIVVLSPLLLLVAGYYRVLDWVAAWRRRRENDGSGER